jgi:AcrR family transcriptional regulator
MPNTSRDLQREQSRERLFHASLEIFRRDGFRAARVDDITLVAGLSRTSFYFHFPAKEDVLLELNRRLEEPTLTAVQQLPAEATLAQVLSTVATLTAAQWLPYREVVVDAMTVGLRLEAERYRSPRDGSLRFVVAKRFEGALASGVLAPVKTAELLADAYLLQVLAAMTAWGSGVEGELEAMLQASGTMFLEGALAKRG